MRFDENTVDFVTVPHSYASYNITQLGWRKSLILIQALSTELSGIVAHAVSPLLDMEILRSRLAHLVRKK